MVEGQSEGTLGGGKGNRRWVASKKAHVKKEGKTVEDENLGTLGPFEGNVQRYEIEKEVVRNENEIPVG